jgi:hypothetical protein
MQTKIPRQKDVMKPSGTNLRGYVQQACGNGCQVFYGGVVVGEGA